MSSLLIAIFLHMFYVSMEVIGANEWALSTQAGLDCWRAVGEDFCYWFTETPWERWKFRVLVPMDMIPQGVQNSMKNIYIGRSCCADTNLLSLFRELLSFYAQDLILLCRCCNWRHWSRRQAKVGLLKNRGLRPFFFLFLLVDCAGTRVYLTERLPGLPRGTVI